MNIFTQFKIAFDSFMQKLGQIYQERCQRNQEELLAAIEHKVNFLKTQKLDSIDFDNLAEADDILRTICEDYNYDKQDN